MSGSATSSRLATWAWVYCGFALAVAGSRFIVAIGAPLNAEHAQVSEGSGGGIPMATVETLTLASIAIIGGVVASRQPRNPIGWILTSIAMWIGVVIVASHLFWALAFGDPTPSGTAVFCAWLASWIWIPAMLPAFILFPLYFPTGRPPSPRWRWVEWVFVAAALTTFIGRAFAPGVFDEYPVANPIGAGGSLGEAVKLVSALGFGFMTIGMVAGPVSLVVRFRRSVDVERQQIKWVASAAVPFPFIFTLPTDNLAGAAGFGILLALLAPSIAVAFSVLRYRLYDIDIVISRTLLVAGLAGFITVTYVAIVVGVGSLVGRGDEQNLVLSIAATALVAVAFQPVRRRLQRVANRLVFGRRATPYDVLSGFATRVGAAEAAPETLVGLAELMSDGTGAQPARVWLRVGPQLRPAATWPIEQSITDFFATIDADTVPALPDADLAVPVSEQDELLGVLTIAKPRGERVTEVDVDLVERLAAASGVLLRNLRLDAELSLRLKELEASRQRLVEAQDDARRRIEAELGGGPRAQLQTLREHLTQLSRDVDPQASPKSAMLLDQLVAATNGALDTLASLAAGVYPPRLAADGLVAALTEQSSRAPVPVEMHESGVGRYPADVEAAVYFAVLEALQNVAKYADATNVTIRLTQELERLTFVVTDDGAGFDPTETTLGTGLQGIVDRLDTVNGVITIESTPGQGTHVAGTIPIAVTTRDVTVPTLAGVTR